MKPRPIARPRAVAALGAALALAAFLSGGSGAAVRSAAAAEPVKAAVYEFDLIDTSLEGEMNGPRADEQERLAKMSGILKQHMRESGRYEIVDVSPLADQIARVNLQGCNGCDAGFAEKLGADIAVTGTVQKVSNLILNINIYVRDADSRKLLHSMSADIRSNTDHSWRRGLEWLIEHRLLTD